MRFRDLGEDPKGLCDLVSMGEAGWVWARKDEHPVKVTGAEYHEAASQAVGELEPIDEVELVKSRYSDEVMTRTQGKVTLIPVTGKGYAKLKPRLSVPELPTKR